MATPIREIAIIGAGNGGCAAAADLTLRGFSVRLYGRSPSTIAPIQERGGIELSGSLGEHFAPIAKITNDAGEAMRGADLVVLMGPTHAHGAIADDHRPAYRGGSDPVGGAGTHGAADTERAAGQGPQAARLLRHRQLAVYRAQDRSGRGAHHAGRPLPGVRRVPGRAHRRARRALTRGLSVDCARRQPAGDGVSLHQRRPSSAGDPVQCRPRRGDRRRLLPLL